MNSNILLVVDTSPLSLTSPLSEILRFSQNNILSRDSMETDKNEHDHRWYLSFTNDTDLNKTQLHIASSHKNYLNIPDGENFEIRVRYRRKSEAFRGFGLVLGALRAADSSGDVEALLNLSEEAQFETMGLMVDCSRNAVMLPDTVFFLLRNCALMGFNMLQLYTEDTYEVEGEPFFGYLRGRYTQEELVTIDGYAFDLGIEVIPCIQTLGHLGQILQWPRFGQLRDTAEVLLARSEDTYDFVERMIRAASAPFRSKRIHIGMDEAHGLGEGRFRSYFGRQDGSQIFVEHLQRVNDICKNMQLKPMIWSDMLFCLAAKNNSLQGYYDHNITPAPDICESIPSNVELVYWDYYHTSPDVYAQKITQHRELGCAHPWVAGGAWTWNRLWCALPFTLEATSACLKASKAGSRGMNLESWNGVDGPGLNDGLGDGVKNCMMTIWGDEGNECDILSALPALMYFAAHGYTASQNVDMGQVRRCFAGICGADFDSWVHASKLDSIVSAEIPTDTKTHFPPNTSKWLLWEDPFLSFMSPQYEGYDLETHYQSLADYLFQVIEETKETLPFNSRLEFPALVASVLALKCHLRERLVKAYRAGDRDAMLELAQCRVRSLRERVDRLWKFHRNVWHATNKPFGWEVLEIRYGGLRTRLETMYDRLIAFVEAKGGADSTDRYQGVLARSPNSLLSGSLADLKIPELETDLETVYKTAGVGLVLDYNRVATPSRPG